MLDESFLQWLSDSEDMRTMVAVRGKGDVAAIPHAAHMVWMRSVTDKIREHYRSINPNQRIGKPSSSKLFFHEIARGGEKS